MIPLFRPNIPKPSEIDSYLKICEKDYHYTNFGQNHRQLEEELSLMWGGHWLPVTNGTVAIQVALMASLPKYSRVAVPDFTFSATALAVIHADMTPVIFACEKNNAGMDPKILEEKIDEWDALLLVSPFGYSLPYQEYRNLCKKHRKRLICDFAAAFPMNLGDEICTYSLHAGKSLPIGEGGLIRFSDPSIYEKAKRLICFDFDEGKNSLTKHGLNAKMDEFRCALARLQLKRWSRHYERILEHRDLIDQYQDALISSGVKIKNPIYQHVNGYPSICVLRDLPAEKIVEQGKKDGIVFRRYYHPWISEMPAFRTYKKYGKSHSLLKSYVALPSDLKKKEFEKVVRCILKASKS